MLEVYSIAIWLVILEKKEEKVRHVARINGKSQIDLNGGINHLLSSKSPSSISKTEPQKGYKRILVGYLWILS